METETEAAGKLTILRNKTSNRLEENQNQPSENTFVTVIRVLYACLILLSLILLTSPRTQVINGVFLDAAVNITTIYSPYAANPGARDASAPNTSQDSDTKRSAAWHAPSARRAAAGERGGFSSRSILAVPALFGRPMSTQPVVSPLLILGIDACHPFSAAFPDNGDWFLGIRQLETDAAHVTSSGGNRQDAFEELLTRVKAVLMSLVRLVRAKPSIPRSEIRTRVGGQSFVTPKSGNETVSLRADWYALVPRGNCPFDVKIFNAKTAGFAGIIIHNKGTLQSVDVPVRMSPNKLGAQVTEIRAMFVTQRDGNILVKEAIAAATQSVEKTGSLPIPAAAGGYVIGAPLLISLAPEDWPLDGWGSGGNGGFKVKRQVFNALSFIANLLFLVGVFVFFGGTSTAACLFITMIRNYFADGRMFVVMLAPHISLGPLWPSGRSDEGADEDEDILEQIVLPLKVIQADDLKDDDGGDCQQHTSAEIILASGKHVHTTREQLTKVGAKRSTAAGGTRMCCAICIDEFVVGSKARELPCHHQFHTNW
ncbi:hypothetical protein HDU84_009292 [Entophlyctis sp. JEL0112]|nr:hypothetical protein HDU84_009292 [Entophlyctis sp. JEL0112]